MGVVVPLVPRRPPPRTPAPAPESHAEQLDRPGDRVSADDWFQDNTIAPLELEPDDPPSSTLLVRSDRAASIKRWAVPIVLGGVLGLVYFIVAGRGSSGGERAASARHVARSTATPEGSMRAPAPSPPASQPAATAPAPDLAVSVRDVAPSGDAKRLVRVESAPAGATAMLVDNGKTSALGSTPITATLDPARSYDIIVTLDRHEPQIEHVDAISTVATASSVAPAAHQKVASQRSSVTRAPAKRIRIARAGATPAAADASATGILMVSAKPPCDIVIDGARTGLTTPQRSISLRAGRHTVVFLNAEQHIRRSFAVTITTRHPTKLIESFLAQRMK